MRWGGVELTVVPSAAVLVRAGFLVCSIGVNISDSFARYNILFFTVLGMKLTLT